VAAGLVVALAGGYALMKLLRVEEVAVVEALIASLRRRLSPGTAGR
jgi:hypothetical protein